MHGGSAGYIHVQGGQAGMSNVQTKGWVVDRCVANDNFMEGNFVILSVNGCCYGGLRAASGRGATLQARKPSVDPERRSETPHAPVGHAARAEAWTSRSVTSRPPSGERTIARCPQ